MKVIFLGDTHIGARNDSLLFHDYFELFYKDVFFPYIDEYEIKHVIQFGDLFDRRKYVNYLSLHRAKQYLFDPLAARGLDVDIIVGNHDTYFRNTNDINSLNLLLREYNFNIWDRPVEIDYLGETPFLFVPWINSGNEQRAIDAIENTKAHHVIGHFEIQGFEMYKGHTSDVGLNAKLFDRFKAVYSGHFHHKSTIGNIHYLGTPYEITWSDFDDPRGFHVFDTYTQELEFIENPHRMFIKTWYDDQNKTLNELLGEDFTVYKDKVVKMIVTNKTNPYWFDSVISEMEKVGVADLQVVDDHLNLNLEDDEEIISDAEDTLTILNKVVQQTTEQQHVKERLDLLIKQLYSEALTVE